MQLPGKVTLGVQPDLRLQVTASPWQLPDVSLFSSETFVSLQTINYFFLNLLRLRRSPSASPLSIRLNADCAFTGLGI